VKVGFYNHPGNFENMAYPWDTFDFNSLTPYFDLIIWGGGGNLRGRDRMVVGFIATCAISANHHNSFEFGSRPWWGVLDTTLCDKVCQWLAAGLWFFPCTPVFSTNKTDRHDITEMLLKVELNSITNPTVFSYYFTCLSLYISNILNGIYVWTSVWREKFEIPINEIVSMLMLGT
jgi:hypothetical protein